MGFTSWVFELPGLFEHGPLSSEVIHRELNFAVDSQP